MSNANHHNYQKLTAALLAAWFLLALTASALQVFSADSRLSILPPIPLGLAVLLPVLIFLAWHRTSPGFRQFSLSLNPRTLTFIQSWRLGGFVFLILEAHGLLPAVFAQPAGWGDIAVGATAPLVAIYLAGDVTRRRSFVAWNIFGMLDLAMAVTLGVLASNSPAGILARGVTTDIMTVLPLSLIPTFAVPLLFIFHIISIAGARQARSTQSAQQAIPQPASGD